MSVRRDEERRVAEIWKLASTIQWRISHGLYSEKATLAPATPEEEMAGEALAFSLQRIGMAASRLTFKAIGLYDLPWDQIAGLRNVLSYDYPGVSWSQIWEAATDGLEPLMRFCETYASCRGTAIEELAARNHVSLGRKDEGLPARCQHRWDDEEA